MNALESGNLGIFKIVDDFAKQYYSGDISIGEQAQQIIASDDEGNMRLVDFLTEALPNYLVAKSELNAAENSIDFDAEKYLNESKNCGMWASKCLHWITRLRGMGLISETESVKTKLEKSLKINERLKERNDKLIKKNLELETLNQQLHRVLNRFGVKGNSSDVEGTQ